MKKLLSLLVVVFILTGCQTKEEPKTDPVVKKFEGIPFTLKGVEYTLPVPYKELVANGWDSDVRIDYTLNPNSYNEGFALRNDRNVIWVSFYNDTDEPKALEDTLIGAISAENRQSYYDDPTDIQIFDGLGFETPLELYIKQFGEPSEKVENARFTNYTFKHEGRASTTLKFSVEDGRMEYIEIDNKTKRQ